jgi:hypothetical protein
MVYVSTIPARVDSLRIPVRGSVRQNMRAMPMKKTKKIIAKG